MLATFSPACKVPNILVWDDSTEWMLLEYMEANSRPEALAPGLQVFFWTHHAMNPDSGPYSGTWSALETLVGRKNFPEWRSS
jgi:hypothetical protein